MYRVEYELPEHYSARQQDQGGNQRKKVVFAERFHGAGYSDRVIEIKFFVIWIIAAHAKQIA
jgi:hypothetical protein